MPRFRAGLLAIVVIAVGTYFGFTKANPFASPYELTAAFDTVNNLKPNSPVRIAGVDVGKVTEVEPVSGDSGAAVVKMEIKDKGLPIHEDATHEDPAAHLPRGQLLRRHPARLAVGAGRSRTATTRSRRPRPPRPVQFGDLLASLQSDTREDLQVFLQEYAKGLEGGGARGLQPLDQVLGGRPTRTARSPTTPRSGSSPTRDVQRLLKGQAGHRPRR